MALWLCVALAGCSTMPPERPPEVTNVSEPAIVVAEPGPIAPEPVATPASTPPPPAGVPRPAANAPLAPQVPAGASAPATSPKPAVPVPSRKPPPAPQLAVISPPQAASAVRPPAPRKTETWISLERWSRELGLGPPFRMPANVPGAYSLSTSNGPLTIRVGSLAAHWNGVEFRLGYAPQFIGGRPFIHSRDAQKNLEPLLNNLPRLTRTDPVIVLDPGHGGTDSGSKCLFNGHFEKDFTLDWARRLQALLLEKGWSVFLTRSNDVDVGRSNRVIFAEQHKADLFLSLHFNSAAPDEVESGLETYCLTPAGMPSSLTRGYSDNPAEAFPNNRFDAQNLQLSVRLHRALLKVNGNLDRGVRRARFPTVLQGQNRPAVLVEGGYLSNPREGRKIADPAYRQKLAEALAGVIVETLGPEISLASRSAVVPAPVPAGGKLN